MRCEELRGMIGDFVDGTISPATRGEIAEHLEHCGECRREVERLLELLGAAASLPRSLEPSHDLWPTIAARIARDATGRGQSWDRWPRVALSLAAALALIVSGVLAVRLTARSQRAATPETAGAVTSAAAGDADLSALTGRYRSAREELRAVLAVRRQQLSPATVRVVEENLAVIDRAVEEITTALVRDPGNRELTRLLLATYENEVDLLRRASRLAPEG